MKLISDLMAGLVDFFGSDRTEDGDYDFCLWFSGGNGTSYNNMLTLRKYLQTQEDTFWRLKMMQAVLQAWHTMWTDLSCTRKTYWDDAFDKIGLTRKWPPSCAKHDFIQKCTF